MFVQYAFDCMFVYRMIVSFNKLQLYLLLKKVKLYTNIINKVNSFIFSVNTFWTEEVLKSVYTILQEVENWI